MQSYTLHPIGIIHSPYNQKFGTPRQPGLVKAKCSIELLSPYNTIDALKGLDGFSHIWVSFVFHQAIREHWKPTVRPPRLGGDEKVGVFASRAPFRPNHLGLSVVKLINTEEKPGKILLQVDGLDAIDGTPVVDIKPYIPYVDAIPDAVDGFASGAPEKKLKVEFSEQARRQLDNLENSKEFHQFIMDVLGLDPRPAYKNNELDGEYGILLQHHNIRWRVSADTAVVESIKIMIARES